MKYLTEYLIQDINDVDQPDQNNFKYFVYTQIDPFRKYKIHNLVAKFKDLSQFKSEMERIEYTSEMDYLVRDKFRRDTTNLWEWTKWINKWCVTKDPYLLIKYYDGVWNVRAFPIRVYKTFDNALNSINMDYYEFLFDLDFKDFIESTKQK